MFCYNSVNAVGEWGKEGRMSPEEILDRTEACQTLRISRQTLISWIRKGKLKVWKRVGHGSNAALLFERSHIQDLSTLRNDVIPTTREGTSPNEEALAS